MGCTDSYLSLSPAKPMLKLFASPLAALLSPPLVAFSSCENASFVSVSAVFSSDLTPFGWYRVNAPHPVFEFEPADAEPATDC